MFKQQLFKLCLVRLVNYNVKTYGGNESLSLPLFTGGAGRNETETYRHHCFGEFNICIDGICRHLNLEDGKKYVEEKQKYFLIVKYNYFCMHTLTANLVELSITRRPVSLLLLSSFCCNANCGCTTELRFRIRGKRNAVSRGSAPA